MNVDNTLNTRENSSTQQPYEYGYVDLPIVVKNPEEYIIPGCLGACRSLWDKNIETFMVSNLQDDHLYVLLMELSENNLHRFQELMKVDSRYFYTPYRSAYGIQVLGTDAQAQETLIELTNVFEMQDVMPFRYQTKDEFLKEYKTQGGEYDFDSNLHMVRLENPELANVTFEEALEKSGKQDLYVPEEGRVYVDALFLSWHQRYINSAKNVQK